MFPISDRAPQRGFPFIAILLIFANFYFFLATFLTPNPEIFIFKYALIPQTVDFSNLYTLVPFISAQFMHAGLLHLVSNMWFLWIFGDNVEGRLGSIPFLAFYLFAGTVGFLVQYLFLAESQIPMLGASAAVSGVLGSYLVFFPKARVNVLVPFFPLFFTIPLPAQTMLFYWFFIQLFNGVASITVETAATGGVAYWAHIGGFGAGFLFANLLGNSRNRKA